MRLKSITIFFLFISLLTLTLGCWQLYRLNWKNDLINNINSSISNPNYFSQEIIDYNELTAVKLNNKYQAKNQPIFIESKTYQNKVGYHAIIPLLFNDEIYSVLNLGWFSDKNDKNIEKIINQFNQKIDVIVYLRFLTSKKNLFVPENDLDSNTWFSINHDDLEKYFQDTIISPYYFVILDSEIKFDTNPIIFLRNNHLNYSITWFLLSISSIVMLLIIRRKNG
tara:strand:- start:442 stop:1113 length:672 start_codon:yes stop_codon:yes gene_type:complete